MSRSLDCLYDLSAHIRAARAVARVAAEQLPASGKALELEQASHLGALSEAVRCLLDQAHALANALEATMEGAAASALPAPRLFTGIDSEGGSHD